MSSTAFCLAGFLVSAAIVFLDAEFAHVNTAGGGEFSGGCPGYGFAGKGIANSAFREAAFIADSAIGVSSDCDIIAHEVSP